MRATCTMRVVMTMCLGGATATACATFRGSSAGELRERLMSSPDLNGAARRSDVVTAAELGSIPAASTVESLRRLRPEFFRPVRSALDQHGAAAINPVVYVDDAYNGALESLETVPKDAVVEVRFLRPMQAVERWGPSCPCAAGVIQVVTSRGR
ncbi:MAG TPA: hypothetical protein VL383_18380 [Gemmatimonadaceae bacterium]|nr:hypothetical protein [Gemmatimonadaceae bacterium]